MEEPSPVEIVEGTLQADEKILYTTNHQFSYSWTLTPYDIRYMTSCDPELISTTFTPGTKDVWCLKLRDKDHHCSLHLCLISSGKSEIKATYMLSIVKADGSKILTKAHSDVCTFVPGTDKEESGFIEFIGYDAIFSPELCPTMNDEFTILCEVNVVLRPAVNCNELPFNVPECQLLENLNILLESEDHSDVTFYICGRPLRAHKAILAMRSRVFGAMFEHEMAEKIENEVGIDNVDYEVFQEILRFIYTGKVLNIDKMAEKLLAAANMYDLERLKIMCEEVLRSNLAIKNAAQMLIFADLHNAEQLKSRAATFINANLSQVFDTEGFRSMTKSHPTLMTEVLRASLMKYNSAADKVLGVDQP